jgi:hypothetical protein
MLGLSIAARSVSWAGAENCGGLPISVVLHPDNANKTTRVNRFMPLP